MNRREFNRTLFGAAAAAMLGPRLLAEVTETVSPQIASLYKKAIVMDSLSSLFADQDKDPTPAMVEAVRRSGITAINATVSEPDYDRTVKNLDTLAAWVKKYPDPLTIIGCYSDIARAKRENKLGVIPGFQYTSFFEEKPDSIETFRKRGVLIMQLTYNKRSAFGYGCLEPDDKGLTPAGVAAVKTMNKLGVAVDLSHSGYRTTADGITTSAQPVLISHAGCAAVYPHPRNKPDNVLKLLADHGGYFGVYLMPYLCASPKVPTLNDVLDHMVHALNVCGTDHVGVGCDNPIEKIVLTPEQKAAFDADIAKRKQLGIGAPGEDRLPYVPELSGPDHMLLIAQGLSKRGQPDAVVEKVLGANFQRVLGEIWGPT